MVFGYHVGERNFAALRGLLLQKCSRHGELPVPGVLLRFGRRRQPLVAREIPSLYHGLGCPVLLGVSRKSFIGRLSGAGSAKTRLPGSLAAALAGLDQGVQMLRVHDVAETAQAIAIWRAIGEGG